MLNFTGKRLLALVAVFAGAVLAVPAQAGDIHGKVFKDWVGQCETAPDGREFCYILQRLQRNGTENTLMITQVGYHLETDEALVVFHLPAVLDANEKLLFKTDDNDVISINYRCQDGQCRGGFQLDKRMLGEFRRGRQGLVGFTNEADGEQILFPVSLMGFTAGFKSLQ